MCSPDCVHALQPVHTRPCLLWAFTSAAEVKLFLTVILHWVASVGFVQSRSMRHIAVQGEWSCEDVILGVPLLKHEIGECSALRAAGCPVFIGDATVLQL
jgi:hypothetical protein